MNPLSPFTYTLRHKRQALLLVGLIATLTLGVFVVAGAMLTGVETGIHSQYHLTRMSRILAAQALDPGVVAQIRAHPDVATVLPENGLAVNFPAMGSILGFCPVLGVTGDDLEPVMKTCDLRLKEGRLIIPRAAEIVLSEKIVRALGLQIGDVVSHDIDEDFYPAIATELTLVGILEPIPSAAGPEVLMGFVSYEYLEGHELYQPRLSNLLIIPRQGHRSAANNFVTALVDRSNGAVSVRLETFEHETEQLRQLARVTNGMYILADGVVALSAALVVGMVNRIAIAHRLPELGLLHATGYSKRYILRRLVREIVIVTGVSWASGLLLSVAFSILLNTTPLAALGPVIDLANPILSLFTLPIPLAVVGWVIVSVRRVLNQLDTVAIIERGKLSMEQDHHRGRLRLVSTADRSSHDPLSSWTFHLRHRRRSLALLASTGLMVLGVAFPPFVYTMMLDSVWPLVLSYSSHASIVSPASTCQAVDPAVLAQIRAHPGVARVIPVRRAHVTLPLSGLTMATNSIPFEFSTPVYAVHEGDMQALLDVYDLYIGEGELPQPRSGQIVLTRALAQNRGLSVGDTVGKPVHERDGIPTELTVVGLLDSRTLGLAKRKGYHVPTAPRWAAFVSYEFVESHKRYAAVPMHALVIPVKGYEEEVETWLEESIPSPRVEVETFGTSYRYWHGLTRMTMPILATTESILAVVAALALAILNTIFVAQRRDEFGVLHAVGHSRARLIARTVRESIGVAGAAWLVGAACCLALVLGAQTIVYVPRGMSLDLANATPWLFTLPIPLATVAASAGTIAWALSRLDPATVIERR
jgi:ABC-type antimicrobial peptide transport system permease subunit